MLIGIIFFLRDICEAVNILMICRYFLNLEIRKRRTAACLLALAAGANAALYGICSAQPVWGEYAEMLTDIISYALYIITFLALVKCTQKRRTLLFLTCYVFVADMLYGVAARYIGDNAEMRMYFQLVLFFALDAVIIIIVKSKHSIRFPDIISITPRWIFISIMIFCLACYYRQFGVSSAWYEVIYLSSVFLMLMSIGFFIFNMIKATQEINLLYQRMNDISAYYMRLAKNDEELRAFRHDYKNHMNVVSSLIEQGEVSEASRYISELSLSAGKCQKKYSTGNEILDMILTNKSQTAEKFGFTLSFRGFFPPEGIESADVCTICANLIDNCIEHGCVGEGKNDILIESDFKDNSVILKVSNNTQEAASEQIETTKQDKKNHGFGIKNIKKTVKKYDGVMTVKQSDKRFCVNILMKIKDKNAA